MAMLQIKKKPPLKRFGTISWNFLNNLKANSAFAEARSWARLKYSKGTN